MEILEVPAGIWAAPKFHGPSAEYRKYFIILITKYTVLSEKKKKALNRVPGIFLIFHNTGNIFSDRVERCVSTVCLSKLSTDYTVSIL